MQTFISGLLGRAKDFTTETQRLTEKGALKKTWD
jgi:hypothetical protein